MGWLTQWFLHPAFGCFWDFRRIGEQDDLFECAASWAYVFIPQACKRNCSALNAGRAEGHGQTMFGYVWISLANPQIVFLLTSWASFFAVGPRF